MSSHTSAQTKRYYLGIDGGGTNTRALLADESGRICGCGFSDSSNPNHYSREEVSRNLSAAISSSLKEFEKQARISSLFMGASGVSTGRDIDEMRKTLQNLPEAGFVEQVSVDNDTQIGLTGGLAGRPGAVLISGTGSACFGENRAGEKWLCGGWGPMADDAGSAPWIGIQAIRAAVKAEDGRSAPTMLQQTVFSFLELRDPRELIYRLHNEGVDRAEIGRLAPLVVEAFEQGDPAASNIVLGAARSLAELLKTAVCRLFGEQPCDAILAGGLALSGPPFQPLLLKTISELVPNVSVREPQLSPVKGAVLEAMKKDGVQWSDRTIALLKSDRSL